MLEIGAGEILLIVAAVIFALIFHFTSVPGAAKIIVKFPGRSAAWTT